MIKSRANVNNLEYVTVDKAAKIFRVSKGTIRKWSDENKISSIRHPFNNYRLFRKTELEDLEWKLFQLKKQ